MANYPKYTFDDNTDYAAVEATVNLMYSDYYHQSKGCCQSSQMKDVFNQVNPPFYCIGIDKANGDTIRYKADVKAAYLILYSVV